jgi:hypothetical protein
MSSETSWRTHPAPSRDGRRPEVPGAYGLHVASAQAV